VSAYARYIAHSNNGEAVRQIRVHRRRMLITLALLILASAPMVWVLYVEHFIDFGDSTVSAAQIVSGVLVVPALIMGVVTAKSRRVLHALIRGGTVLRVDGSVRRDYIEVVMLTNTNFHSDDLFDRQKAMNAASKAQDVVYCKKYNRDVPEGDNGSGA
jgi:ABC-type multidrug transport system fused ATPase/permease subunit